jgi:hypothetical protein
VEVFRTSPWDYRASAAMGWGNLYENMGRCKQNSVSGVKRGVDERVDINCTDVRAREAEGRPGSLASTAPVTYGSLPFHSALTFLFLYTFFFTKQQFIYAARFRAEFDCGGGCDDTGAIDVEVSTRDFHVYSLFYCQSFVKMFRNSEYYLLSLMHSHPQFKCMDGQVLAGGSDYPCKPDWGCRWCVRVPFSFSYSFTK